MPNQIDGSGRPLPNTNYVRIAASQTTSDISTASENAVKAKHYVSHLIITAASTAAPGGVTLLDGGVTLLAHFFHPTQQTELVQVVPVDVTANTTKGFNVTTGTSVAVVVVGRF